MPPSAPRRTCPDCGADVRDGAVLIEYEPSAGGSVGYAECPDCQRVVKVDV